MMRESICQTISHSAPFVDNSVFLSLLRHTSKRSKPSSSGGGTSTSSGGLLKIFKLFPMLSSGCKMVALLGRPRKPLLKDNATTGTVFGYRKGRVSLAIQEDPHCPPIEFRVMQQLRGVSMGAGVLPSPPSDKDGELTYMRARFERVVGSKDSEALYMINPDGAAVPESSIEIK